MVPRLLEAVLRDGTKSALVVGPRQTGKSTLFHQLKPDLVIDLADEATYLDFAANPAELISRLDRSTAKTVFIDEVQRLPSLLNTTQSVIDAAKRKKGRLLRFWLTGSSARKLRRGEANLLPGRVLTYELGPLAAAELDYSVDTALALQVGTLPEPYLEHSAGGKQKLLRSYAGAYLREEVQAEALTRSLESFSRFLDIAAQTAGSSLDFSKMANRAKVARRSAMRYFEILEDTLLARRIDVVDDAGDADVVKHPKFYLFDVGVLNALIGNFTASADRIGVLFEHLIVSQLYASAAARDRVARVRTFRTRAGLEIDFVIDVDGNRWLLEAKATTSPNTDDVGPLKKAARYFSNKARPMLVHIGVVERTIDGVPSLPWQNALRELGL